MQKFIIYSILSFLVTIGIAQFAPRATIKGDLIDSKKEQFGSLTLRRQVYREQGFMGGSVHVFSSKIDNEEWKTIFEFRHDDPFPDQIHFLFDLIGHDQFVVGTGWKMASTSDRGKTWSIWDAEQDLPQWKCCNYKLINKVIIEESGHWSLLLNPLPHRNAELPRLISTDKGRTWTANNFL